MKKNENIPSFNVYNKKEIVECNQKDIFTNELGSKHKFNESNGCFI